MNANPVFVEVLQSLPSVAGGAAEHLSLTDEALALTRASQVMRPAKAQGS
jgi:L-asparaginase II